jgi:hypothetical protein
MNTLEESQNVGQKSETSQANLIVEDYNQRCSFALILNTCAICDYLSCLLMLTETEDSSSLNEALQVTKEWNPDWSPKYCMWDYADEEINALGNVFPGILIIIIVICLCKHTI